LLKYVAPEYGPRAEEYWTRYPLGGWKEGENKEEEGRKQGRKQGRKEGRK
jgi:hypothetical protein